MNTATGISGADEFDRFMSIIDTAAAVPKADRDGLKQACSVRSFPRGSFFLRAGERCASLACVHTGMFRFYYCGEDGREYTSFFAGEGCFIPSYALAATGGESRFFIEALEPSRVVEFPFRAIARLEATSPAAAAVSRNFMIRALLSKERREASLILDDGRKRYEDFLSDFPGLERRLKLVHIASYLGMSPVSLSRIRRKIRDQRCAAPA